MSWMGWRTPAVDFSVRVHSGLDLCPPVAGVWGGPIRFGGRMGGVPGACGGHLSDFWTSTIER